MKKAKKKKIKRLPKKVKRTMKSVESFGHTRRGHKWAGFSY